MPQSNPSLFSIIRTANRTSYRFCDGVCNCRQWRQTSFNFFTIQLFDSSHHCKYFCVFCSVLSLFACLCFICGWIWWIYVVFLLFWLILPVIFAVFELDYAINAVLSRVSIPIHLTKSIIGGLCVIQSEVYGLRFSLIV